MNRPISKISSLGPNVASSTDVVVSNDKSDVVVVTDGVDDVRPTVVVRCKFGDILANRYVSISLQAIGHLKMIFMMLC